MKTKIIILILALGAISLVGCNDMDKLPQGDVMTNEQKKEVATKNPDKLSADAAGLYSDLLRYNTIGAVKGFGHYDYGFGSEMIMLDASGSDMFVDDNGYNWYSANSKFLDRTDASTRTYFKWNFYYTHIRTANALIITINEAVGDNEMTDTYKHFRGQALASRAFDYLQLVQTYQFTYLGHEDALGVPIVTEETTTEEVAYNVRATVKDVYTQIMKDLDEAIILFDGFKRQTRKEFIDINVAYGLRARANLLMGKWQAAADDAEKAMVGYTPYTIAQVSKPGFNDIAAKSWIWGMAISEIARIVTSGIVNFPSHMSSFTGNGYTGYNGYVKIGSDLWSKIDPEDVRKGWWLDDDIQSPLVDLTWRHPNYPNYLPADFFEWTVHANVKFGAYKDVYYNGLNACDVPLMRVEEMILIKAEGLARAGNLAGGKTALQDFVATYRQPGYVSSAADLNAFIDEVWIQRRVELWGEGFALFDILRLKKPIDRTVSANCPPTMKFNIAAEDQILIYLIPKEELNANKAIINNPGATIPKAVP